MTSALVRQTSFAGGEVSPLFYGRTDHPLYASSLRKCLNFLVLPHGPVQNRPGTRFSAHTKGDGKVLLVPFVFSSTQTYVLEFGDSYVRFYSAGGQLVTGGPPLPYEVATPFTAAMLPHLKFAQVGDVLTICYGGQVAGVAAVAPQELRRLGHTNWTIGATSFAPPAATVNNIYLSDANGNITGAPGPVPDATHPAKPWNWVFTLIVRETATGIVSETTVVMRLTDTAIFLDAASTVPLAVAFDPATTYPASHIVVFGGALWTSLQNANTGHTPGAVGSETWWVNGVVVFSDKPIYFNLKNVVANAQTILAGYLVLAVQIYKGRHGVYGLIGTVDIPPGGVFQFIDDGKEPDFSYQPPKPTDPFATYDAAGAVNGHDYPSAPTFFEQRRLFARQGLHAQRIQGSKIGQFSNFDVTLLTQSSDAISFDLASLQLEEIRSLVPLQSVFVLTQSGVWTLRGYQGQALGPTSVNARKHRHTAGASWVNPVLVGESIVYANDGGGAVWEFFYDPIYDAGRGTDLSAVASHFLEGHSVVSMAYAQRPFRVIWMVRDDGLLLGLTYLRGADGVLLGTQGSVLAWHQHLTDGLVEGVCSVPEGAEDAVYLVVNRNGQRSVERMASRKLPTRAAPDPKDATKTVQIADVRFGVFLDASLQFDGRNVGATTMKVTGASFNADDVVNVEASAASFAATDVDDQVVIDADGTPTRITVTAFTDLTHIVGRLEAPLPPAFQNFATALWGWARDTMTGLDHLEGKSVTALVDGVVQGPLVVAGGKVQLAPPGLIVQAGLPYNSELELLDVASDQARTNVKAVSRVTFELIASRGFYAGQSFDKLRAPKTRKVSDNFDPPALITDQVSVDVDADWNTGGRAVLRQSDPLPLTVTGAIRELVAGGR